MLRDRVCGILKSLSSRLELFVINKGFKQNVNGTFHLYLLCFFLNITILKKKNFNFWVLLITVGFGIEQLANSIGIQVSSVSKL